MELKLIFTTTELSQKLNLRLPSMRDHIQDHSDLITPWQSFRFRLGMKKIQLSMVP